jgi:hypothetical protein
MCIYYRDLLEYGDYRKTRIHYCADADALPLNKRNQLPCHVSGYHGDIIVRHFDAEQFVRQQQAQRGAQLFRTSQRQFSRLYEERYGYRAWIEGLAASLMRFEDEYRKLGCRYYGAGAWYAHIGPEVPSNIYYTVLQAFHSDVPLYSREFFQP